MKIKAKSDYRPITLTIEFETREEAIEFLSVLEFGKKDFLPDELPFKIAKEIEDTMDKT